ncbi:MAG: hypothetical protein A2283_18005 [Lentisphaerae bacterium RIFOXYA12_FULL_48_11]|nr:MAG: hypothetical protein A2283_18005 [Lentisphaerae bacterium RIFOXYA12_FULL_48_11]
MSYIFRSISTACIATIMVISGPGCAKKKPEGSTGPLSNLYSNLQKVVQLNRDYKAGNINQQVFDAKAPLLEKKIADEYNKRKDDIWNYSINIISNTPIAKETQKEVGRIKPVVKLQAIDNWNGELKPLAAMYAMLPMQMTMTVIQPAFSQAELKNLKLAFRPVELIYRDNNNCTTAFQFGYKIITADFSRQEYRWKPGEIRIYLRDRKDVPANIEPGQSSSANR